MSYSCYKYDRRVKTQVYESGRSMTLGEITDILNIIGRLSPSTRRLLIERPEAVEACVEATKKQKASVFAFIRGDESAENIAAEYYVAINNAIALLPEEM